MLFFVGLLGVIFVNKIPTMGHSPIAEVAEILVNFANKFIYLLN